MVDDDANMRIICGVHLRNAGYEPVVVDGVSAARVALAKAGSAAFDAVLTDYRMPEEDGLDLLRHARETDATLSVVIMTAEGEKQLVMSSLRQGAQNFIEKPLSGRVMLEAVQAAVETTRRGRLLEADARSARAIGRSQQFLLGRETALHTDRMRIRYFPHERAGGDFVASFPLSEGGVVVLVSDVSGHDLAAAYHSAYLQGMARGLLQSGVPLAEVFGRINRMLLAEWNSGDRVQLSLACCAVCVNWSRGSLSLLNCGLPHPVRSDREGWPLREPREGAAPLGWFDELPPIVEHPLEAGLLQFWSDGLEDLAERLGVAPLALAYRLNHDPEAARLAGMSTDDVVVGWVNLDGGGVEPTSHPLISQRLDAAALPEIDQLILSYEKSLRLALPRVAEDRLVDVLLCLRESLLNALVHGCAGRPDREVTVAVRHDSARDRVCIRVSDTGDGHAFDLDGHEQAAAEQMLTEHRGLILLKNLSESLTLDASGRRVTIEIPLSP